MKTFFYSVIVLLTITVATDLYSVFTPGFFYTTWSMALNIGTTLIFFIYVLLYYLRIRNKKGTNAESEETDKGKSGY